VAARLFYFAAKPLKTGGFCMETRVALIGIIVEDESSVAALNELLHGYGQYIIGRMGVPYRKRGVNIISVVLDAPQDAISALSGKIGRLHGVSAKTQYSKVITRAEA
jgi:putative iron-only hydrogenase system regulator